MSNVTLVHLPNKQLSDPLMYFSLGLLYVASVLRERGHNVKIVDLRDKELDITTIPIDSEFVGFTATTAEINDAKEMARLVKLHPSPLSKAITIIGGPHATLLANDCKDYFDCVIVGEGENTILDVVEWNARGTIYAERIKDLDLILFPAWDLLPEERRFSNTLMSGEKYGRSITKAATIIASRGCHGKCSYCGNCYKMPVTFRSPLNVYKEIKRMKEEFGVTEFRFEDDNFTLRRSWQKQLCDLLQELDIQFKCHTRADLLTEEKAQWAKQAGCVEMGIGVESGDNRVLKLIQKQETTEDFKRAIGILRSINIRSKVYLMSALPGETPESVELTKKFMREAKPDKWTLSIFCCYPGNAVFKDPKGYGIQIINHDFASYWNFPDTVLHEFADGTTSEELYMRYKDLYNYLENERWKGAN